MICHYFDEPSYLVFVNDVPPLLYYSHIPVTLLALFVGVFLFVNNPKRVQNQLLFVITLVFSAWTVINLIAWTNIHSDYILTIWPFFGILSGLISVFTIYFAYAFTRQKDAPLSLKVSFLVLLAPLLLFAHTNLSVRGFHISDCDAFGFEGLVYNAYYSLLGLVAVFWSLYFFVTQYFKSDKLFKKQIVLMSLGIEFFLLTFISITWLASHMANIGLVEDSDFEFYGLFGMAVLMVFIGVLMTQFKTFKVGILATQALLVALVVLVGSQLTFASTGTASVLAVATLLLTLISGVLLNRSIKKEAAQREKLEHLTTKLEKANEKLTELDKLKSEFVSIASHQLRSPLTSIRGYASMLAEGSFGVLPAKAQESAERITESARLMAMSIEDYLNVSRIESGNMKYNLSDFNLKTKVEEVCDDLRPVALKQSLILLFRTDLKSGAIVNADVGKVVQIVHNLINNSIKYTPKGSISVFMRDDIATKKIYVEIIDTGIGMNQKTIDALFGKFSRADNANSVNAAGTGLGLFVARKMADAMGGDISAHSDGDGKGSRFTLELPLAM